MDEVQFHISVPTDEGFLGRECDNSRCKRYFRVYSESIRSKMFCPYCATEFSNDQLHTPDQLTYFQEQAEEEAKEYIYGKIDEMFHDLAQQFRGSSSVSMKHNPVSYKAKEVTPKYHEKTVDTELVCPGCTFRFQVYGIFGYCPGCRSENMLIYDANLSIIRSEITRSENPNRALRHAYSDLVATFQMFCKRKVPTTSLKKPTFQELFQTRKFFKDSLGIDIFSGFDDVEMLLIRRIFQKRHVCQHAGGVITEEYVRKIPEDKSLLGMQAQLSIEEFDNGSMLLRRMLDNIVNAMPT